MIALNPMLDNHGDLHYSLSAVLSVHVTVSVGRVIDRHTCQRQSPWLAAFAVANAKGEAHFRYVPGRVRL